MKKSVIHSQVSFISDGQTPEISDPCNRAFHFPSPGISPKFSTVLSGRFNPVFPMRTNQIDPLFLQSFAQRVRVSGPIINQSLRFLAGAARSFARNRYLFQERFDEFDLRRRGRLQEASQRNTLAVDHHHPLRTLSTLGFSDCGAPFFAGAKLPSANTSDQSIRPFSSNSDKKARQAFNQAALCSQNWSRRQQVLADGYRSGKSLHLAPLRKTQSIPSKQARFEMGLGPPRFDALGLGKCGLIFSHCSSGNKLFRAIGITSGSIYN